MIKPIRIIGERDKMALYNLFEYLSNEKEGIVKLYASDLQTVAELLEMDPETFQKETGLEWKVELEPDFWENYDD